MTVDQMLALAVLATVAVDYHFWMRARKRSTYRRALAAMARATRVR